MILCEEHILSTVLIFSSSVVSYFNLCQIFICQCFSQWCEQNPNIFFYPFHEPASLSRPTLVPCCWFSLCLLDVWYNEDEIKGQKLWLLHWDRCRHYVRVTYVWVWKPFYKRGSHYLISHVIVTFTFLLTMGTQ